MAKRLTEIVTIWESLRNQPWKRTKSTKNLSLSRTLLKKSTKSTKNHSKKPKLNSTASTTPNLLSNPSQSHSKCKSMNQTLPTRPSHPNKPIVTTSGRVPLMPKSNQQSGAKNKRMWGHQLMSSFWKQGSISLVLNDRVKMTRFLVKPIPKRRLFKRTWNRNKWGKWMSFQSRRISFLRSNE
jgi:hypothetical protein